MLVLHDETKTHRIILLSLLSTCQSRQYFLNSPGTPRAATRRHDSAMSMTIVFWVAWMGVLLVQLNRPLGGFGMQNIVVDKAGYEEEEQRNAAGKTMGIADVRVLLCIHVFI